MKQRNYHYLQVVRVQTFKLIYQRPRICIPSAGFDQIEKARQVRLDDQLRTVTENGLNNYVDRVLRARSRRRVRKSRQRKSRCLRVRAFGVRRGRPPDRFLPDFLFALEKVFLKAGGRQTGVTWNESTGMRESPVADFVSAILRFAPPGVGPRTSQGVAIAWGRLRRRRAQADGTYRPRRRRGT